jgi:F-type H+-transporting ATPase subunit b
MKINWFTVIAQVINFLVLVWLLKRFLYKPILNAIDEREKKITSQLKDADDKKADAVKQQDDFTKKNADFDQQKKEVMDKAIADANTQRQKLLDGAKDEANKLSAQLEEASKEKQKMENIEIAKKTQREVFAITRKALTEIASVSLEEQSVGTFIKRLNESKDEEKTQFMEAFKSNSNTILVRSAFDMPEKQQAEISSAVGKILGTKIPLQFKTATGIISGIELTTNGYKLAWSLSEYLNSLQKNISEATKEKANAEQEKKAAPEKKAESEKEREPVKI